ncbi:MAG TPA: Holliday junction resolvase RecU [Solibacillus sp.]
MTYSRSHANRGAFLERVIDMANNKYRNAGVADIRKIPTPFKPLNTKGGKVTGHFEKPTWVDYSGIYNGDAIIFDAKQTALTNFPLDNLSDHQYNLLDSWSQKGAVAFLIVYFSKYDKYYYLPFATLKWAKERADSGGRKSIAYKEFETMAQEVKSKDGYTLHYLEAV